MRNLTLENMNVSQFKLIPSGTDIRRKGMQIYGFKRRYETDDIFETKLKQSIDNNDWSFPFVVAKLEKEYWLIDGYLRINVVSRFTKYPTLIIPAKDYNDVIELYCQYQSRYGTPCYDDFCRVARDNDKGVNKGLENYELGIRMPLFDVLHMTREQVLEAARAATYKIM
jgi:hypothetical protein